jgi:hypothetical protein
VLVEAVRQGAPRATLVRMASNIALDACIGAVPLLGDIFDVAWKANVRNVALLERHLAAPARAQRADRLFVVSLLAAVAIVIAATITVAGVVSAWLLRALGLV